MSCAWLFNPSVHLNQIKYGHEVLKTCSFDFHKNQCLFLKWTSPIMRMELCWGQQSGSPADLHVHKWLSRTHMAELVPATPAPCLGFMHRSCLCLGRGGCKQVGHIQRNRLFFFFFFSLLFRKLLVGSTSSVSQKTSEADSLMMPSHQNTNVFSYFLPLKDSSNYLNLFSSCGRVLLSGFHFILSL